MHVHALQIVISGLALQLAVFLMFIGVASLVLWLPQYRHNFHFSTGLVFFTLFITIALLLLRNSYRLYEFVTEMQAIQNPAPIELLEWQFYAFDAIPVLASTCLFTLFHFGLTLPSAVSHANEGVKPYDTRVVAPERCLDVEQQVELGDRNAKYTY